MCYSCRPAGFLQTIYSSRLRSEIFQSTSAIKCSGKQELLLSCGYLLNSQGNWDRTRCPPHLTAVGFRSWFASTKLFTIKTKELLWKALKSNCCVGSHSFSREGVERRKRKSWGLCSQMIKLQTPRAQQCGVDCASAQGSGWGSLWLNQLQLGATCVSLPRCLPWGRVKHQHASKKINT